MQLHHNELKTENLKCNWLPPNVHRQLPKEIQTGEALLHEVVKLQEIMFRLAATGLQPNLMLPITQEPKPDLPVVVAGPQAAEDGVLKTKQYNEDKLRNCVALFFYNC
jgi:hypothetical protein